MPSRIKYPPYAAQPASPLSPHNNEIVDGDAKRDQLYDRQWRINKNINDRSLAGRDDYGWERTIWNALNGFFEPGSWQHTVDRETGSRVFRFVEAPINVFCESEDHAQILCSRIGEGFTVKVSKSHSDRNSLGILEGIIGDLLARLRKDA